MTSGRDHASIGGTDLHHARLADMSWPEVETGPEAGDGRALLIPLGATEQHGPHLPLDTDTRIAVAVAEIVASRRDDVLSAPCLPYGASGEHADFPGTLSMGSEALEHVLVELGRSVWQGIACTVFVNGHGGNADALNRAVRRLCSEGRSTSAWFPRLPRADAHAGRTETSLLLSIAPGMVRGDSAAAGVATPLADLLGALRADGVRSVSPNGVLGDPTGASAEEGLALLTTLADDLDSVVSEALSSARERERKGDRP